MNQGAAAGYLFLGILMLIAVIFTRLFLKKKIDQEIGKKLEMVCFVVLLLTASLLTIFWS